MKVRVLVRLISAVLAPLILTACHSDSTGPGITAAAAVTKLGTDPTSVIAGTSFSDSIRVLVTDAANHPKSGVGVGFAVTAGGGSVTPAAVITDGNGKAASKFITGTTVGANTATATVTGFTPVTFSISTIATPPPLVWSSVSSGTIPLGYLSGVWGASASDVWAVGGGGGTTGATILHYNGSSRSSALSGTQNLSAIWRTSASDVWAVGTTAVTAPVPHYNGVILHYDGTRWSSVPIATTDPTFLRGIWGTSASNIWAVGQEGYDGATILFHYDGATWSRVSSGTISPTFLSGIWGTSASDIWAVGGNGYAGGPIIRYNGTTWASVSSGTTPPIHLSAVWGSSAADVWAVGVQNDYGKFLHSIILHYNGTAWSPVWRGTTGALSGIWGTSASDVWAVGGNGTILHYNGTSWSSVSSGTTQYLSGVWASSPSDVWVTGGTILHYDGTTWSSVPSPTIRPVGRIWGSSASDVWAVAGDGSGGELLHHHGSVRSS